MKTKKMWESSPLRALEGACQDLDEPVLADCASLSCCGVEHLGRFPLAGVVNLVDYPLVLDHVQVEGAELALNLGPCLHGRRVDLLPLVIHLRPVAGDETLGNNQRHFCVGVDESV